MLSRRKSRFCPTNLNKSGGRGEGVVCVLCGKQYNLIQFFLLHSTFYTNLARFQNQFCLHAKGLKLEKPPQIDFFKN
jgi:hypothetical protein